MRVFFMHIYTSRGNRSRRIHSIRHYKNTFSVCIPQIFRKMAIKRCFFVYAVYVPLVYKYAFFCGIWPQVFGLFALFCACWLLLRFGSLASSQNMAFFGVFLRWFECCFFVLFLRFFCGFFCDLNRSKRLKC